jgi:hypothetical protein
LFVVAAAAAVADDDNDVDDYVTIFGPVIVTYNELNQVLFDGFQLTCSHAVKPCGWVVVT